MADPRIWLRSPDGKPYWLVYGIRHNDRMIYIGRTSKLLHIRWGLHLAKLGGLAGSCQVLSEWLLSHDLASFDIVPLACARTKKDASVLEMLAIEQWDTLAPHGTNDHMSTRHRAVISAAQRHYNSKPEVKRKKAAHMAERWADPLYRKQTLANLAKFRDDPKRHAAIRLAWQNADLRAAAVKRGKDRERKRRQAMPPEPKLFD